MQVRNDSVSCIQRREVICKYATIVYQVSCIQRREVICKYATIVYLVYNDARLYASTQR